MYKLAIILGFMALQTMAQIPEGYHQVPAWQDDFSGDTIDGSRWYIYNLPKYKGTRNSGLFQEMVSVENGHLVLRAAYDDQGYLRTGGIGTANLPMSGKAAEAKFESTYGYFEARVKFQKSNGLSFAFWLQSYGTHSIGNEGNDGMEIDIIETPELGSGEDKISQNLHWDGYHEHHVHVGMSRPFRGVTDGDWHIVALDWTPEKLVFYVDGQVTWQTIAGDVPDVPEFILLTLDAGWVDYPPQKENIPDKALVDWVRVYKKE
jgi:beta-glucanase (GH16 family)